MISYLAASLEFHQRLLVKHYFDSRYRQHCFLHHFAGLLSYDVDRQHEHDADEEFKWIQAAHLARRATWEGRIPAAAACAAQSRDLRREGRKIDVLLPFE